MAAFDPLQTLAKVTYRRRMRAQKLFCCVAALSMVPACNHPTGPAGPHFANLCVARSDWSRLLSKMRNFGAEHHLEMHGGIDTDAPNGPMLNAYLAQGYSYYFGDDFDLWFVSDPFRKNVVTLGGVLKRKPITAEQEALANALLSHLSGFTRRAKGPSDNPSCE